MKLAIIGGGSWGTALSIVLAPKFDSISLWVYEAELADRIASTRENNVFLPGFRVPEAVRITTDLGEAASAARIILGVMPSQHARAIYTALRSYAGHDPIFVSATKGLESNSLSRISEVIRETQPGPYVAVLSGPTFAREIAAGEPAAVVVASSDPFIAEEVQAAFSSSNFRLYTNADPVGVEIGAALKNVIAIAAGCCEGLGLGSNIRAALITRGLAEITRLAVAMGGQQKTLAGLAGLGDLVLTCTGDLSRNRRVGIELARGRKIAEITASTRMIAEGVETCDAAKRLGAKMGVDLPIIQQVHAILYEGKPPHEALRELMERSLKGE